MPDKLKTQNGLRALAILEAAKAILILVVGFGLLSLVHHDAASFAESLVKHVHLNPASKYPHIFIQAAGQVTNANMWFLAAMAMVDSIIRGIEAYGLWRGFDWGKWLGFITAVIYLPVEIYELALRATWFKSAAFLTNILIVVYLVWVLYSSKPSQQANLDAEHAG